MTSLGYQIYDKLVHHHGLYVPNKGMPKTLLLPGIVLLPSSWKGLLLLLLPRLDGGGGADDDLEGAPSEDDDEQELEDEDERAAAFAKAHLFNALYCASIIYSNVRRIRQTHCRPHNCHIHLPKVKAELDDGMVLFQ